MGTPFNKAIVGFLVPVIAGFLVNVLHIQVTDTMTQYLGVIILGVITFASVYMTKNKSARKG